MAIIGPHTAFVATVIVAVPPHPVASFVFTEYSPGAVTSMDAVVAVVFQRKELNVPATVSVDFSSGQISVSVAVIAGVVLSEIVIALVAVLVQPVTPL